MTNKEKQGAWNATLQRWGKSPEAFRDDLMVEVSGSVHRWGDIMDDWQREDFKNLDPGLLVAAGQAPVDDAVKMRSYWERPRGHSKTTDLSAIGLWFLLFAVGIRKGIVIATDRDVAALTRDAVLKLLRLNPMLAEVIEVQREVIVNKMPGHPGEGSELRILTSDVASSWGLLVDLCIADEVTHWTGDGELMSSIISTIGKKKNGLMLTIANAGVVDSWQYKFREEVRSFSDTWIFSRLDGPRASWMSEKMLEEQRRLLPKLHFDRVWLNCWAASGGDALPAELIDAAFHPERQPMSGAVEGFSFIGGLDLGLVRDNAALTILAVPSDGKAGKIRLAHHKVWKPVPGQKIDLLDVEKYLLQIDQQFQLAFCGFDPWQAEHLAQTIEADSGRLARNVRRHYANEPFMREIPPTPANLRQQASLTIEFFNDRRLEFYDCPELHRDLTKLRVEEKSYGYRLTSPRDGDGHGDLFSSFALALQVASEVGSKAAFEVTSIWTPGETSRELTSVEAWQARCAEAAADFREGYEARRSGDSFADALAEGRVFFPNR